DYLAEATKCYLLNLNRACIAMCRACLEDCLEKLLTPQMAQALRERIELNKKRIRREGPMQALIEICNRYAKFKGRVEDAHFVRKAGNKALHLAAESKDAAD